MENTITIYCTHCKYPHEVSEHLRVWHWNCYSCGKVFDWRAVQATPVYPPKAKELKGTK